MTTIGIRHTVDTITPAKLAELYDLADAARHRLRAVRMVCEQLDRTADDIEPPHFGVTEHTDDEKRDAAEARAIRRCTAAVYGALQGHGHEPRIPTQRDQENQS